MTRQHTQPDQEIRTKQAEELDTVLDALRELLKPDRQKGAEA